jgi:hypothetical protein
VIKPIEPGIELFVNAFSMSCSTCFTASAGFQPGSAATQNTATSAKLKTRKIFITRYKISYAEAKRAFSARDV